MFASGSGSWLQRQANELVPFKFLEDVFGKLNWRAEVGFAHVGFRAGAVAGC